LVGRGALKKNERPRTCPEPHQKSPTHLLFVFILFTYFFIAFLGVSQQVEFKNTKQAFWENSMSKMFYKANEKKSMSFPPYFFVAAFF
jgi:hypothetical protein